ncbi:MAG: hypothetical protein HGA45_13885 [Chloroflexales bacterium]|nr:hypothetical protein [Chloroflexales bacterium]
MSTSPKIMLLMTLTTILISAGTLGSLAQAAHPTTHTVPGPLGQRDTPSSIPYALASWLSGTAGDHRMEARLTAISDRAHDVVAPNIAVSPVRVRLAVSSSVPAHASAEGGAIAPDDLLVAAPQSGYVMRAPAGAPAHAIIGKAHGRLAYGTGVINIQETVR